jgi:hypothetical protein
MKPSFDKNEECIPKNIWNFDIDILGELQYIHLRMNAAGLEYLSRDQKLIFKW